MNLIEVEKTVNEIKNNGGVGKAYEVDVTDRKQEGEAVEDVLEEFSKIDILVNNTVITMDSILIKMTEEQWDRVIDVILKECLTVVRY
ncbi:short chain dehydrogenase [Tepidimicrobium xylanilyticum]|uniref:Short chain dehydrogenase n=1 Tax=Tepidimicrobium xylanilyticum TaxID=1123352 RepID=A0A1H3DEE3_9FIRM|nr:SDR family NAD(P)-dependent oxidoreductase [Tepidimicrobium xylanilyticum]SDX64882.1 short chain dehydrogenase [Tepidimicrobium xylanilyticum]